MQITYLFKFCNDSNFYWRFALKMILYSHNLFSMPPKKKEDDSKKKDDEPVSPQLLNYAS